MEEMERCCERDVTRRTRRVHMCAFQINLTPPLHNTSDVYAFHACARYNNHECLQCTHIYLQQYHYFIHTRVQGPGSNELAKLQYASVTITLTCLLGAPEEYRRGVYGTDSLCNVESRII
jgi:hypothetical protein